MVLASSAFLGAVLRRDSLSSKLPEYQKPFLKASYSGVRILPDVEVRMLFAAGECKSNSGIYNKLPQKEDSWAPSQASNRHYKTIKLFASESNPPKLVPPSPALEGRAAISLQDAEAAGKHLSWEGKLPASPNEYRQDKGREEAGQLPCQLKAYFCLNHVPTTRCLPSGGRDKTKKDWKKTRNTSPPPILCFHARDSAQVTQTAESTWRNRSVPIAPATPSPLRPSLGPTMRPCAAPAVRPGIWRRDGGNIRQIFKTEPREQSRPLCSEAARELGAAGPRARC
ncbi:hypothetical protein H8959_016594 [Pygathrix nigripes]